MTEFASTPLITPDDDKWFVDGSDISIFAQVAVDRETCVFAATLHGGDHDYYDANAPYSRFYRYSRGRWVCAEVNARIVSMCPYREPDWTEDGLAVLGEDGRIWFLGKEGYEARVDAPGAKLLGTIRMIDDSLFVTGYGGRIFRRTADGWKRDDLGIADIAPPVPRPRPHDRGTGMISPHDLIETTRHDLYLSGTVYTARPALFWRPAGGTWAWLGLDAGTRAFDYVALNSLFAQSQDEIWISTNQGYLLKGNGYRGFEIATEVARKDDGRLISFGAMTRYRNELYAGGTSGCRVLPDGRLEQLVGPPQARMGAPDVVSTAISGALGAVDDVLWAIGYGCLSRFDGSTWERIPMPSVYRHPRS